MKKLSQQLNKFINDSPGDSKGLSLVERKMFVAMKSFGSRATRGRQIDNCVFEAKKVDGCVTLRMIMEGRHSGSVGHQVAKRFDRSSELEFVEVVKTKRGAKVVMRAKRDES